MFPCHVWVSNSSLDTFVEHQFNESLSDIMQILKNILYNLISTDVSCPRKDNGVCVSYSVIRGIANFPVFDLKRRCRHDRKMFEFMNELFLHVVQSESLHHRRSCHANFSVIFVKWKNPDYKIYIFISNIFRK